jgi:hypothetical protein
MGTKSRETIYGASVRAAAEARREADKLACEAWNKRMLGFKGPAQPSPTLGDALTAGSGFVEDFLIPIKASFVSLISFPTHPLGLGWEIPVLPPLESPGGAFWRLLFACMACRSGHGLCTIAKKCCNGC